MSSQPSAEVVDRLKKQNGEFRKLKKAHSEYEEELEELQNRSSLTSQQQRKEMLLKKKKLRAKDRMYEIIRDSDLN